MEQRITAPKGCKIDSVEHDDNSVVIMFSEDKSKPRFKKGDFLTDNSNIVIYKCEDFTDKNKFVTFCCNSNFGTRDWNLSSFRLCTEEEKQKLLNHIHSNHKDWDEDNMEVVPYVWKPKAGEKYWFVSDKFKAWYSYYDPSNKLCYYDIKQNNCFYTEEICNKYAEELKRILKERKL